MRIKLHEKNRRFVLEFLSEEYPFHSQKEALNARSNAIQEMLKSAGSLISSGRCKLSFGDCWIHLLDYQFVNYDPDLWKSSEGQWNAIGSVFDDQEGIRKKLLSLIQQLHSMQLEKKSDADISDVINTIHKSEFSKLELLAILEVEELLRKCCPMKSYPRGSLHKMLLEFVAQLADFKTGKKNAVSTISKALRLDQLQLPESFDPQALSKNEILEFISANEFRFDGEDIDRHLRSYRLVVENYLNIEAELKNELSSAMNVYLSQGDFAGDNSDCSTSVEWVRVTDDFQYRADLTFIRFQSKIFEINEKVRSSLGRLIHNFKHQDDALYLPTKEDLIGESKYSPRNLREFKVKKTLFPREPLKSLVQFDRTRGGYYLALSAEDEKKAA
jgi:hypothetical protein